MVWDSIIRYYGIHKISMFGKTIGATLHLSDKRYKSLVAHVIQWYLHFEISDIPL